MGLVADRVRGWGDDPGDDTGAAGAYGLDDCTTSIGSGVPEFFETWFRCVTGTASGGEITIASDGLPPHPSPYYDTDDPNWEEFDTQGGDRFQNPNRISSQALSITFAEDPTPIGAAITETTVDGEAGDAGEFQCRDQGMSLDGVGLFKGTAAPGDSLQQEERTFDQYEGHPQGDGVYHHHGANPAALFVVALAGFTASTVPGSADVEVYGIMCDGTLVFGCTELDGSAPSGTLDAQNGHAHDVADAQGNTHFEERYHVHACASLGRTYTPEVQYYEEGE